MAEPAAVADERDAEIARLRAALAPFVDKFQKKRAGYERRGHDALKWMNEMPSSWALDISASMGEMRAAEAALAQSPKAPDPSLSTGCKSPGEAPLGTLIRIDQIIPRYLLEVAELPDRTSPEGWPQAMLVTGDELDTLLRRFALEVVTGKQE